MTELLHASILAAALILVAIGCGILAQALDVAKLPPKFVYQDQLCHWNQGRVLCEVRP